jgi:hypothetical protein
MLSVRADYVLSSPHLGPTRFDFKKSYLVRSKDKSSIRTLERNIKTFYAPFHVRPTTPIRNGNTETFDSSILPGILQSIDTFNEMFPHAEFQIEYDISSLIPPPRIPKMLCVLEDHQIPTEECTSIDLQGRSEEYQDIIRELAKWCTPRGKKQELANRLGVSRSLVSLWITGKR